MTYSNFNKFTALTLFSVLTFYTNAFAGSCGTNCTYTIDDEGNVVITGTGNGVVTGLQGIDRSSVKTITIGEGITSVGDRSMTGMSLKDLKILGENVNVARLAFYTSSIENGNITHNGIVYSCGEGCTATLDKDGNAVYTGTGAATLSEGKNGFFKVNSAEIGEGITSVGDRSMTGMSLKDLKILGENVNIAQLAFYTSSVENIAYVIGGLTEEYVLSKYPNANKTRIFGPRKQWTVSEAMEAIQESRKRGYKPDQNTVTLKFK